MHAKHMTNIRGPMGIKMWLLPLNESIKTAPGVCWVFPKHGSILTISGSLAPPKNLTGFFRIGIQRETESRIRWNPQTHVRLGWYEYLKSPVVDDTPDLLS